MTRFDLLRQATCAILRTDPGTGREEPVGTAWLAMSPGYLLTAGHVVRSLPPGPVRVRFPGPAAETASVRYGPFIDEDRAVDVAVLELDNESSRQPLPMLLTSSPEGDVLVAGYGQNLPNAQSLGVGEDLRPYTRNHLPADFLLQYKSRELTFQGFSGGAVYSLTSRAVVGIQTESSPASDQVLAMPISRIPQYWKDLTAIAEKGGGLCVVLVSDRADEHLLGDIIGPVLESLNLEMYVSSLGRTTARDMNMLERSTLVIADATQDDAYVVRELTVAQGLGTPDVVVSTGRVRDDRSPLHPSVLQLDPADVPAARRALVERLVTALTVFEAVGELTVANPITRFFGAPLTRVSAANALALGYFRNFVSPVGRLLAEATAGLDATIKVGTRRVDLKRYSGVRLRIVLPDKLSWATDEGIRKEVERRGTLVDAEVSSEVLSRPRPLKALRGRTASGQLVLVDVFPTTMATMIDSINDRFAGKQDADVDQDSWDAIERKEIDRFGRSLARRLREDSYAVRGVRLEDVCGVVTATQLFPDLGAGPPGGPPVRP